MLPLFYRQVVPVSSQTFALAGSPIVFNLPRESVIDQINVYVEGSFGVGAATAAVEGLSKLVQSITVRGSIQNAPQLEPVSGLSGPDMFELAQFIRGMLPATVGSLGSAAKFRVSIPIYFRDFFMSSEAKNLLAALPAFRMSELTCTITPATQAQVDTNAAPTLTVVGGICGLEIFQFYRNTVPDNVQFYRATYEATTDSGISTATDREIKLPSGGDYSLILARAFGLSLIHI